MFESSLAATPLSFLDLHFWRRTANINTVKGCGLRQTADYSNLSTFTQLLSYDRIGESFLRKFLGPSGTKFKDVFNEMATQFFIDMRNAMIISLVADQSPNSFFSDQIYILHSRTIKPAMLTVRRDPKNTKLYVQLQNLWLSCLQRRDEIV